MFNIYEEYLASPIWNAKRDMALDRDNHKCRRCNSDCNLRCHHGRYTTEWGTEPMGTLFTLCNDCHTEYHEQYGKKPDMSSTLEFIKSYQIEEKIEIPKDMKLGDIFKLLEELGFKENKQDWSNGEITISHMLEEYGSIKRNSSEIVTIINLGDIIRPMHIWKVMKDTFKQPLNSKLFFKMITNDKN